MATVQQLASHDPLPTGPSIVVMRRFEEDAPSQLMMELVIIRPDHQGQTLRAAHPDGTSMTFAEAIDLAQTHARTEGLGVIWQVDRAQGPREQEILRHHGDHSVNMDTLADTDPEDGERGSDLRDRGNDGGPRRF